MKETGCLTAWLAVRAKRVGSSGEMLRQWEVSTDLAMQTCCNRNHKLNALNVLISTKVLSDPTALTLGWTQGLI
eukprot:10869887-Heterocapsa_arctica.AAC.1